MAKQELSQSMNRGKIERVYASILDFTVEEIELLQSKLRARKNYLMGTDKNRNRDTISL